MTDPTLTSPEPPRPRDAAYWARPISKIKVADVPAGATNLNVDGHTVVSPLQGFGALWQRTYRVRLPGLGLSAAEVMRVWKENFPKFQPPGNHFYPPLTGIDPGKVIFIDSTLPIFPGLPGLIPIAAGVVVIYEDDECFMVMTPDGFPESGWNTFSVYEEDGVPVAQVQSLARAADPIYEFGLYVMGGVQMQEGTWQTVLTNLAAHFGLKGQVQLHKACLDPRWQWSEAKNLWRNAAIRTFFYVLATPLRWLLSPGAKQKAVSRRQ
jgi:hypothetical protein